MLMIRLQFTKHINIRCCMLYLQNVFTVHDTVDLSVLSCNQPFIFMPIILISWVFVFLADAASLMNDQVSQKQCGRLISVYEHAKILCCVACFIKIWSHVKQWDPNFTIAKPFHFITHTSHMPYLSLHYCGITNAHFYSK